MLRGLWVASVVREHYWTNYIHGRDRAETEHYNVYYINTSNKHGYS